MTASAPLPEEPDARAVEMTKRLLDGPAKEVRIERTGKTLRIWATGAGGEVNVPPLRSGRR
jgi:hypothetical protein